MVPSDPQYQAKSGLNTEPPEDHCCDLEAVEDHCQEEEPAPSL